MPAQIAFAALGTPLIQSHKGALQIRRVRPEIVAPFLWDDVRVKHKARARTIAGNIKHPARDHYSFEWRPSYDDEAK